MYIYRVTTILWDPFGTCTSVNVQAPWGKCIQRNCMMLNLHVESDEKFHCHKGHPLLETPWKAGESCKCPCSWMELQRLHKEMHSWWWSPLESHSPMLNQQNNTFISNSMIQVWRKSFVSLKVYVRNACKSKGYWRDSVEALRMCEVTRGVTHA